MLNKYKYLEFKKLLGLNFKGTFRLRVRYNIVLVEEIVIINYF